jgi:hypothetical protein
VIRAVGTKIFQNTEYAAWRSLRESEDARYLGLVMPRFLSRLPYGPCQDSICITSGAVPVINGQCAADPIRAISPSNSTSAGAGAHSETLQRGGLGPEPDL